MASVVSRLRNRPEISRAPNQFLHQGQPYPFEVFPATSLPGSPVEASAAGFEQIVRTMGSRSAIVAGAVQARSLAMSQVSFRFRSKRDPSRYFGTAALDPLENPSQDVTTWGLLSRVEPDIAFHGNAYWRRLPNNRIVRLRPDWMTIVIGSNERPNLAEPTLAADAEVIGYIYKPGGSQSKYREQELGPTEVMHWAPEPHPLHQFIGESWVSKVWREIAADMQTTDHVSKFFDNAATANMVAVAPPAVTSKPQFDDWVDAFDGAHRGLHNAWKTIYTQAGTDIKIIGSDLASLAMEDLQGGFETRVSAASRVPATVALFREGNKGSSMNGGNYGQIRRMWADAWFSSYAQGFCASVARIINVPSDAELTFDPERVLLLQEDQKDAADIQQVQAQTVRALVDGGFSPDAAVEFVRNNGDLRRLLGEHSGLYSVQLQEPGATQANP